MYHIFKLFADAFDVFIQDSSSDEPVMAPAIASDSDEEVVFTKPNVAGSAAVQRDEEDTSHPKTWLVDQQKTG